MGRIILYIMENKKCSKPPTSYYITLRYIPTIICKGDLEDEHRQIEAKET